MNVQPLLPLVLNDQVEAIRAGAAVTAFAERRVEQLSPPWNHTPERDLEHSIDFLVCEARARLHAFVEISGKNRMMRPPPARRDMLRRKIEIAGALLIAAYDRLLAEVPDDDDDDGRGR